MIPAASSTAATAATPPPPIRPSHPFTRALPLSPATRIAAEFQRANGAGGSPPRGYDADSVARGNGVAGEGSERVKVAIVGSGPAGLSAASRAAQLGLSHVLIEKTDHLSDTIYKYQKGKHVMATPSNLVLRSDLDFEAGKREVVLGKWDDGTAG